MNKAGINSGDIVLCRKNYQPENGNRVVALIGDDATIKIYKKTSSQIILEPRSTNPDYKPLVFEKGDEIFVQGVVVEVLKK
jgi:repressor LexA